MKKTVRFLTALVNVDTSLIYFFLLFSSVNIFSQDQLFRSTEHNFRIKFPQKWELKDGDGPNIVKKAVFHGNSIMVLVKSFVTPEIISETKKIYPKMSSTQIKDQLIKEMDFNTWSDKELLQYADEIVAGLRLKFKDIRLLEKKITYLDNEKTLYVVYDATYKVQNLAPSIKSMQYTLTHKGKLYQITSSSEFKNFNDLKATFNSSMSTFVLEDYE